MRNTTMDSFRNVQFIINNHLVAGYVWGRPTNKLPLVFLHGWRSNSTLWFNTVKLLHPDRECVFIDLPGFGKSEIPKTPFALIDYVNVVNGFLEKCDIDTYILIGHSFGGSLGIRIAGDSMRVKGLVLVDASGIRPKTSKTKAMKLIAKAVKPLFVFPGMEQVRKSIYTAMGSEDYVATPGMADTYKKIIGEDLTDRLAYIQCPTLIVWGRKDRETPIANGELMHRKIDGSKLEILDAGHFPFIDVPDTFVQVVERFIRSL